MHTFSFFDVLTAAAISKYNSSNVSLSIKGSSNHSSISSSSDEDDQPASVSESLYSSFLFLPKPLFLLFFLLLFTFLDFDDLGVDVLDDVEDEPDDGTNELLTKLENPPGIFGTGLYINDFDRVCNCSRRFFST